MIPALALAAVIPAITVQLFARPILSLIRRRGYLVRNYLGRIIPTAGGVVLLLASLVSFAVLAVTFSPLDRPSVLAVAATAASFAALGLVDDLLAPPGGPRGWRGHLGALGRGEVSTGLVKLLGGTAIAWAVATAAGPDNGQRLVDVIVVAGSADVANLLDTGPRRALTWTAILSVLAMVAGALGNQTLFGPAAVWPLAVSCVSLVMGFWPHDSGQSAMLGDTGAYLLGGMAGTVLVLGADPHVRLAVAVFILVLELVASRVSLRGFGRW